MGFLLNIISSLFLQVVQFCIRVAIILWPIWLAFIIRGYAGELVPNYPWHVPVMTISVVILALIILGLKTIGYLAPMSFQGALALLLLSGVYTFYEEYQRLEPYLAYYSFKGLLPYVDSYAIASGLFVIVIPLYILLRMSGFIEKPNSKKDKKTSSLTHGSAEWFDLTQAKKQYEIGDLVIGEAYSFNPTNGTPGKEQKLKIKAIGHLLSIAGSGGGKTVSVVVPNMMEWKNSVICMDPKTEIEEITGCYRKSLGQKVIRLNADDESTDGFNVLDWIDTSSDKSIMDAQSVVGWLSEQTANESSSNSKFFDQAARNLIEVILLDILFNPKITDDERTLLTVRKAIGQPNIIKYIETIQKRGQGYAYGAASNKASLLLPMLEKGEQTMASILGTADNMTQFLVVPSLSRLVCGNSFKTSEVLDNNITIYIQIPLKTLDSTPAIARLIIGSLLNRIYEAKGTMENNVLVMLDEMPRLGYMKLLETARDAGRSFGINLWAICQSTGQLEKIYGREGMRDWMESCFVRSFFGIQDEVTAEMISKTCGTTTVLSKSQGTSESGSRRAQDVTHQISQNKSSNISEAGRRLITLDEVTQMQTDDAGVPDEQIIFVRNQKPIKCGVLKYHRREDYSSKANIIC